MKAKNHKTRTQIAKNILVGLGVAAGVASIVAFPGLAVLLAWIEKEGRGDRRKTQKAFYSLKKRGMITTRKSGSKIKVVLAPKARRQIEKYKTGGFKIDKPKSWDGRWWMVMFDVPESRRSVRDLIRKKLVSEGFVSIQKSVLAYPYDCKPLIDILRAYYKLSEGELYIFEAKVIEGEETLKKYFKL